MRVLRLVVAALAACSFVLGLETLARAAKMALEPSALPLGGAGVTPEQAALELVKTGLLGTLLVLVGAYAVWMTRQLNATQALRVSDANLRAEDAQKVTATLIAFSTTMQAALTSLANAIEALKSASAEERRSIDAGTEIVRDMNKSLDDLRVETKGVARAVDELSKSSHGKR